MRTTDEMGICFLHSEHTARRARILGLARRLHAVRRDVVVGFGICTLRIRVRRGGIRIDASNATTRAYLPFPIRLQCPTVLLAVSSLELP